jgi:hypothetical protein
MKQIEKMMIILVLFSAALSAACISPSAVDHSPRGVLNTYIKAINDRDTQTVHDTLSSALRTRYDHEYATTRRDPVHDSLYGLQRGGATIQSVMIINQTMIGQTAFVEVDYFWHYPERVQTDRRHQIVEFVNEGGEWKLNNFFPFDEPNDSMEQNMTEKNILEISDQINSTALSIALNNSEVKGSLTGINYTLLDVGPGTLISSSIEGEKRRNLTRIDIDTDKALLTIWIDVSNRSVVYINDYPKRSQIPRQ